MSQPIIKGKLLDVQGRCVHWHSALDIIAIKFACCGAFYACYDCHRDTAGHPAVRWPRSSFDTEQAILCGACQQTMTIAEYRQCTNVCPHCSAAFNPGCQKHWGWYFAG